MRKLKRFAVRRKALIFRSLTIVLVLMTVMVMVSQTALAKNTYVITDGNRTFTYSTFATDPAAVLGEAGLTLDENDTYTTQDSIGVSSITVQRSQDITIVYHGEVSHATSFGETVEQLLIRLNIPLGANDVLSLEPEAQTYDGMILRVEEVLHLDQTYTSTISHETTYCYDSSIPTGTETVITPGVDGEVLCTATVTYVDGEETQRAVYAETVTAVPVAEVIAVGTGEPTGVDPDAMPVFGDGIITLPTGEVLTYTGTMQVRATAYTHTDAGCDLITATGTTVHWGTVAVDPRVIPYGTRMFIVANDGSCVYGIATAEDCGGAIKGDRVDLYMPTYAECIAFGRRDCTIYFLG